MHTRPSDAKAEALRLLSQGLKQCVLCGQVKLLSEFKGKKEGRGGRTARCSRCLSRSPLWFARHEELNSLREIEKAGKRKCSQCGQAKFPEEFAPIGIRKDGSPARRTRCKVCSGWKPEQTSRPLSNSKGKFTPNRSRVEGDTGTIELTDRNDQTVAEAKVSACDLPRVLAAGRWQMADGRWQMADGRWQMADGTTTNERLLPVAMPLVPFENQEPGSHVLNGCTGSFCHRRPVW